MKIKRTRRICLAVALFLGGASNCLAYQYGRVKVQTSGYGRASFSKPTIDPASVKELKKEKDEKREIKETEMEIKPEQKRIIPPAGVGYTEVKNEESEDTEETPGLNRFLELIRNIARSSMSSTEILSNYTIDTLKAWSLL